jgi:hypothetical protein
MALLSVPANGDVVDATLHATNYGLIETSFGDLSPYIVTGLVPSAGSGLAVNVTAGTALISGHVSKAATWTITSLAPSTVNHLYLLQAGTGTSNTTGTAPSNSVKLGTATTGVSSVSSVNVLRSSGRQAFVRGEDMVHGAPGSGRSVNIGAWNATAGDGFEVFGTIPSGALPSGGSLSSQTTQTANYTALSTDYFIFGDATSASITINLPTAVGIAGKVYIIKKIDATGNTVTIDANSTQTLDGALTIVIGTQYASFSIVSNGANWYVF